MMSVSQGKARLVLCYLRKRHVLARPVDLTAPGRTALTTTNVQSRETKFWGYTNLASSYTGGLHCSYEL